MEVEVQHQPTSTTDTSCPEGMKTHKVMNQVMARLLSEDWKRKGILSLLADSHDKSATLASPARDKTSRKRPRHKSACSEEEKAEGEGKGEELPAEQEECTLHEKLDVLGACHILPSESAFEEERNLQRIATGAVVQLFNAVSKHQKELEEKLRAAGKSEKKKTKVLSSVEKNSFISHLKASRSQAEDSTNLEKPAAKQPLWNVLRNDFTKGSKLKDWDKTDQSTPAEAAASSSGSELEDN